jgi:hypothetical protein
MEIPQETPWKIAEDRTLKAGSSPPRAQEEIGRAAVCSSFCDFLIDFGPKNRHSGAHAPEAHDREDLENLHLSEKNRALDCKLV